MSFKPTVLSVIIMALLAFWCGLHIPLTAIIPALGLAVALAFNTYFLGKYSITHKMEDEAQYDKILTQAEQIDEISLMPSVSLFPDIQVELCDLAIAKYSEIGHTERVQQIKAFLENIIL
jgi:dsDNA-binding SOS-regulon protein